MQTDCNSGQSNQARSKDEPIETNIEPVTSDIEIQQVTKAVVSIDILKYAIFDPDQKVFVDL